ncbi:MAG TPA: beta-ketoacyl synthase N-terminal-like domain-containing protein [Polyangiaceae bacterium]|nr:beta-ketoacyl synthase N-terminal-like domain-containing protein [Polyangiaceae bacterium]
MNAERPGLDGRIYITGVGSVSPLGVGSLAAREAYASGRRGIHRRAIGDTTFPVGALPEEAELELSRLTRENPSFAKLDRTTRLALLAAREARRQARFDERNEALGVILGSSRGATATLELRHAEFMAKGRTQARTSPTTTLGNLATNVAREHRTAPLAGEISCACSTALQALLLGFAWLRSGLGEACLVGGTEAPLTPFTIAQMDALGLLSRDAGSEPECQPLAREARDRLVLGEGACVLVLERLTEHEALERGALAEVVGVGSSVEKGSSATGISPEGDGLACAMRAALVGHTSGVDAVVVHAPGTVRGDRAELAAIANVLGPNDVALCSSKWQMGHTLGASGAFGVELAIHLLAAGTLAEPPYASYLRAPTRPVQSVLVNSAGFGGATASVLLRAPGGE